MNIFFIFGVIIEMLKNAFGIRRRFESKTRLDGKVVVITGANTGIGKETAFQLSLKGAKIIIGCRDLAKAQLAVNDIKAKNPKANITVLKLDLSSLTSVRHFAKSVAQKENRIDILINNAGVMMCPEWRSEEGFELQFATNHLGHFLLTLSLMSLLKNSLNARIINVSSKGHLLGEINFENINLRNGVYNPIQAYGQSKLANVLFTLELAQRLGTDSNVKVYCLHPGVINSDLGRHMPLQSLNKMFMKVFALNVDLGSQTTLYCALEDSLQNESGFYYDDCQRIDNMAAKARDAKSAQKLWELSSDLVKLENEYKI